MINVRRYRKARPSAEINISPLIDLIFLLLIFFMVTTSFVKETGVDVDRPSASTAVLQEQGTILVAITADDTIHFDGQAIDLRSVRAHIARALAENPEGAVVIVTDQQSRAGIVVEVMDQCRLAGATRLSIAARQGGHA